MDGEKSSERDCEGDAWVGVVRKKEKEMETGEVGFLFFVAWNGGEGERTRMRTGMCCRSGGCGLAGDCGAGTKRHAAGCVGRLEPERSLLVAAECLM